MKHVNIQHQEKRKHPRTITSIPALISSGDPPGREKLHIVTILDASFGGLQISIPTEVIDDVLTGLETPEFEIITDVPDRNKLTRVRCTLRRMARYKNNFHIGASTSIIH